MRKGPVSAHVGEPRAGANECEMLTEYHTERGREREREREKEERGREGEQEGAGDGVYVARLGAFACMPYCRFRPFRPFRCFRFAFAPCHAVVCMAASCLPVVHDLARARFSVANLFILPRPLQNNTT